MNKFKWGLATAPRRQPTPRAPQGRRNKALTMRHISK